MATTGSSAKATNSDLFIFVFPFLSEQFVFPFLSEQHYSKTIVYPQRPKNRTAQQLVLFLAWRTGDAGVFVSYLSCFSCSLWLKISPVLCG